MKDRPLGPVPMSVAYDLVELNVDLVNGDTAVIRNYAGYTHTVPAHTVEAATAENTITDAEVSAHSPYLLMLKFKADPSLAFEMQRMNETSTPRITATEILKIKAHSVAQADALRAAGAYA